MPIDLHVKHLVSFKNMVKRSMNEIQVSKVEVAHMVRKKVLNGYSKVKISILSHDFASSVEI